MRATRPSPLRRPRRAASRLIAIAALVTGAAAVGLPSAQAATLAAPPATLTGASAATSTQKMCGKVEAVRTAAPGASVAARVPAAKAGAARRARRTSVLAIDSCVAGAWTRVDTARIGSRGTALVHNLDTAGSRDLRVRALTRPSRGLASRPQYLRVGVGEIVDAPVTFKVVNQNRTPVPCLGAPDGKTYEIHGTIVAPRTVLDSGSGATLYLHGLGYSSFFFRFKAVPGYDYGLQQAEAGHASVVVTRLGNPTDPGVKDGNAVCLSSQADTADQMIQALRKGTYAVGSGAGPAFKKVGLAGHSLGGFIAEITQYSFRSADALAVISYNDTPGPLAFAQFLQANTTCFTAPQHAGPGDAGPPGYAPFGATDADFAAAHFHDIDPAVAAATLKLHNRDPCGDLTSATGSLVANQPLVRTIASPVLVISGADDALFPPPTNQLQAATAYPASKDVQLVALPDTGHAVTLGRTHEAFRAAMARWLTGQGL